MDFLDNISLPKKSESEITRYSSFGDDWIKNALRAAKARIYVDQNFNLINERSGSCGRCCASGTLTFVRKDGAGITDDDVVALLAIPRGQENRVQKRDQREITIYWLCDSSD